MEKIKIIKDTEGKKIVEITTIKFSGKRKIDWKGVEEYLKKFIGENYIIEDTDEFVYIGSEFPEEYAHSMNSIRTLGTLGKAKANAAQAIPELIKTVSNLSFRPNLKEKHSIDAFNGWYRGTVRFTLPITDEKQNIIGKNHFRGRMIIRRNKRGKMFLYDIIDIKKET